MRRNASFEERKIESKTREEHVKKCKKKRDGR